MEEKNMNKKASSSSSSSEQECEVRKGPWTMEEDIILINYISTHGEGVWNNLARSAGLKRTGKSCRLRWLNYLRPDIRRGNITPEEQLLIVDLQARWGNRWSKIARQLPGRTDNEIKNYWRTRIQKKVKTPPSTTEKYEYPNPDYQNPIPMELEEASTSIHTTFDDTINPCSSIYIDDYGNNPDGFVGRNPSPPPPPPPPQSSDGFWGVDDLWSMHLFNN